MRASEFRKNMKTYLDQAIQGQPIFFERSGVYFKLESFNQKDIKPYTYTVTANHAKSEPTISSEPKDFVTINFPKTKPLNKDSKDYSMCKHNAVKGFCKKGCK